MRPRWIGLVVAGLAGCGGVEVAPSGDPDASSSPELDAAPVGEADATPAADAAADASPAGGAVLRYDFEAALVMAGDELYVTDVSGNERRGVVTVPATDPGTVERVARDDRVGGSALRFPAPCNVGGPVPCPRVLLTVDGSSQLDFGERDFAVSVDFLLPELAEGVAYADQNLIQKGNFDDATQWKVEVDPLIRISCVFHYPTEPDQVPTTLRVPEPLALNVWHRVRCERVGDTMTLRLDDGVGPNTQTYVIPAGTEVSFENGEPIVVGAPRPIQNTDQFHGTLDEVSVEIFEPR